MSHLPPAQATCCTGLTLFVSSITCVKSTSWYSLLRSTHSFQLYTSFIQYVNCFKSPPKYFSANLSQRSFHSFFPLPLIFSPNPSRLSHAAQRLSSHKVSATSISPLTKIEASP